MKVRSQAFAIDIGCYAHLRKHKNKFTEIDLSTSDAKEKLRSGHLFNLDEFMECFNSVLSNVEQKLIADDDDDEIPNGKSG
jgi:hypothetical protein